MAPKPAGGGGAGAGGKDAQPAWIRLLPIFHCALIAVAVVLAAFRFFVLDSTDRYKCHALLNSGEWLDAGLSSPTALKNWQPDGCILHSYSAKTSKPCLSGRRVLFIGDSTARQVFYAAAQLLDSSLVIPDFYSPAQQQQPPQGATATQAREKHKDVSILASGTQFEFYWDPFLNGTKSSELIASTNIRRPGSAGVNADAAAGGTAARAQQAPAMVVFGSGLWFLRNPGDSGGARGWMRAVDRIFDATQNTRASQMADEVVLLPVETTITSKLTPDRQITLTPAAEAEMNAYLRSRLPPFTDSSISQLSIPYVFNEMTSPSTVLEPAGIAGLGKAAAAKYLDLATQHTPDGMHFDAAITKTQANILLNLRCNDVLPKKFTFDKTCCNQYPAPNWVQGIVILIVLIWGPLGTHYIASRGNPVYSNFFPPPQYLMALTVFGFSIIFMYFSDRTSLFLKIQKQFDFWQFTIAMLASLVLGLVTLKKPEKDLGFLNRDQTDEWKGWMQIAILVYHYYGASKVSGIYNPIRVLVAAYLFMSGYGHFFFYYKKGDYGFARVAGVLVRLNLLTIVLVYVQDTDYLSYYFSPLVTLWFGIIWVTMYVGHQYNKRVFFVGGKIIVSAILAKLFHWFPQPLQLTFGLFNSVFRTQWNAKEWSFRVTLDQWIVYVGMLAALVFIKVQEEKLWERAWWDRVKKGSIAASALAMVWFFYFELARDKFAYNTWHPYVSCVPVLAFIVLRNCTPTLRSTSSRAFIWIGQCSLETFICQFHIWLAGDTKGLLVLLPYPRLRFLNMIFTSAVFLFLSHTIARTTGELTEWILAAPPKRGQASLPTVASSAGPSSSSNGGTAYIPLSTLNGGDDDAGGEYRGSGGAGAGSSHHPSLARWNQLMTNLKFRCAVFMALIWVINLLYPSEHPMQGHLLPTH